VLHDVDMDIPSGELTALLGPNGAGKTTLLSALATSPDVARLAPVALLPQVHDDLPGAASVLDFFRSRVAMYADDAEATLAAYLFEPDQRLGTLSAGELRRLLLATMVNGGAEVLLLDEPTNYLDFDSLDVVEAALREFRGTIVMVTHDRYFAGSAGYTRWWEVRDGMVHDRTDELPTTALHG